MAPGDYLGGLAFYAGTWGATGYVAATIAQRRFPGLDLASRLMAIALVFLTTLIAVHLLPGALGLLTPVAVTLTAIVAALAVRAVPWSERAVPEASPRPETEDPDRLSRAMAGAGVLAVGALAVATAWRLRLEPPTHVDAMSFALPGVAEWIRSGSIWEAGSFLPLLQVRTYPNSGDLLSLAAILPFDDDGFLRVLPVPLLALTGLGVYAIGRELGGNRATAALLGAVAVTPKAIAVSALVDLKPDAFMYATFVGGVLFMVRHWRTGATGDLVLAGLGLGLCFGSRWYGVTTVAVVLAVWAARPLLARRVDARAAARGALLIAIVLGTGGFWLVRNAVLTGNPLYPVELELLAVVVLEAPRDALTEDFGFTVADRLGERGFVGDEVLPALRSGFGLPALLAAAGALLAGIQAPDRRPALLILAAALIALVYLFLPAGAQGTAASPVPGIVEQNLRWVVPAFLLAVAAAAGGLARLSRPARQVCEALALACGLVGGWMAYPATAGHVIAAVVALALVWAFLPLVLRLPGELSRGSGWGIGVATATAAAALIAGAGYLHLDAYRDARYDGRSAVVDWVQAHAPAGADVGVAGHWAPGVFVPTYALFGPAFGNDVEYVGPIVAHQVRLYERAGPFELALERNAYDLLAVGRLEAPDLTSPRPQRILERPPEARWAKSAGFAEVARDEAFVLLARDPLRGADAAARSTADGPRR